MIPDRHARWTAGCLAFLTAASALAQQGPTDTDGGTPPAQSGPPPGEITGEKPGPDADAGANAAGKCPVMGDVAARRTEANPYSKANKDWWPNRLDLSVLSQNPPSSDPMGEEFDYAAEFKTLDLDEVKADIKKLMTTSRDWWPADYGHYGPFMIRMSWHSAGTYRAADGRGGGASGMLRFAPLNSWPDNANLDKARRLLWPVKQKYGRKLSWADLYALTGNCAIESMGVKTFGFGGGRVDEYEPENVYWGSEQEWMGNAERYDGRPEDPDRELEQPLAATHMGLIYVNPQGPNAEPDPLASAKAIRVAFGRMGMTDEETVALIAGGHTFGKAHGAADPEGKIGPAPEGEGLAAQGFGWKNDYKSGKGPDTITSGLEGAWSSTPTQWSNEYFDNLFGFEWENHKGPGNAWQWRPVDGGGEGTVPDAHDAEKTHAPMMFTTDIALKEDPIYGPISKKFREDPDAFELAFAKAWYKLLHRDMGPVERLLGPEVPPAQIWQDPVPAVDHELIGDADVAALKKKVLETGLTVPQLVKTAWASASTYRDSDKRGGANGGRLRLEPQVNWEANEPKQLAKVLDKLEDVRKGFNEAQSGNKKVSMADLIVLAGDAAVEKAAKDAGHDLTLPFLPGRTDATAEMTDIEGFAVLEPQADGFRNYQSRSARRPGPELLVDKAEMLTLSAPEMTVLVGGMRALGANAGSGPMAELGVLTDRPGTLTNDFFVNLLDIGTEWEKSSVCDHYYEGTDRATGEAKWTASAVDLVFGSNSQLRGIAEVYAAEDADEKFVRDFAAAWTKVMTLDRFDRGGTPTGAAPAVARN